MPIELETVASLPFMRHGSPIDTSSRSAKIAASSPLGSPPTSIRYSSPPRWATRSSGRAKRFRRAAISRSTRSPVTWPSDSLTGLKPSRSMNSTASFWRWLCACCTAWASMPSNISRFGRPVRPSRKLRRCSSVSARRKVRRMRASSTENSRPMSRIAHEPTEANRVSVVDVSRSALAEPTWSPMPAAPRTSCWLATRLIANTSADVACQPGVAGLVRSPPRKKAPSAAMQPPAAPAKAATKRQQLPLDRRA